MKTRCRKIAAAAGVWLAAASIALAGHWRPFQQKDFDKARAEGKTVVLDFHADWCPVCAQQKPLLDDILRDKKFKSVIGMTVDYDHSKELQKTLKVTAQATIVVFKGRKEAARAVGITDQAGLSELIAKGLK